MGLNHKVLGGATKVVCSLVLSFILAFMTASVAFGDFVPPPPDQKVLGVGRIQSTVPETPVAPTNKFSFVANESLVEYAAELSEPIAREVAPAVISQPVVAADLGSGWRTTMATNYATPADGFLDQWTAYGTITTETSMGVAHKNLPLGTVIELYCPQSGLSCIATVDDRGPYGGYWGSQPDTFDLQMGTTAALGNNYGWYVVMYRIISSP